MTRAVILTTLLAFAFGMPPIGNAAEQHEHSMQHTPPAAESAAPVIQLSPELQHLLKEEMNAIQKGMQDILPLIAAGEWPQVSKIATKIQQTFIMHQKLTAEQMTQLHQALPPEFISMDQNFHQMAGMLAKISEAGHPELVTFYYYKLADSCVSCHTRFATHRFPALAPAKNMEHKH